MKKIKAGLLTMSDGRSYLHEEYEQHRHSGLRGYPRAEDGAHHHQGDEYEYDVQIHVARVHFCTDMIKPHPAALFPSFAHFRRCSDLENAIVVF